MKMLVIGMLSALVVLSVQPAFAQKTYPTEILELVRQLLEATDPTDFANIASQLRDKLFPPAQLPIVTPPPTHPYEVLAGPDIATDLEKRIGPGAETGDTIITAIEETATKYSVDGASAVAFVKKYFQDAGMITRDTIQPSRIAMLLKELHAGGHLMATRVAYLGVSTGALKPDGNGMGGKTPIVTPMSNVSTVAYIDDLRVMTDFDMVVMGASNNEADYATSMLLSTAKPGKALHGTDIYTHTSQVTGEYAGKPVLYAGQVDLHWAEWGVWGVLKEGLIGGTNVTSKSFGGGVEYKDPLIGLPGGTATWTGTFVGHHQEPWDSNASAAPTSASMAQDIAKGDMVDGRVRLDVDYSYKGVGNMMEATFDKFYSQGAAATGGASRTANSSITITDIPIGRSGSFDHTVADPGAYLTPADQALAVQTGSMVKGQFVGMDGMGAIGVMRLVSEGDGTSSAADHSDGLTAANAGEFHIIGAFGAGR